MAGLVGVLLGVVEFGLFMGLPLVVLVLIYVFWITPNYFFEIVESRALGREGWPVFSLETLVAGRNQIGVLFALLVLGFVGGYLTLRYFGMNLFAQILFAASLVFLPGSVALLAVTRQFSKALNPASVLAAAAGMSHGYVYCLAGSAIVFVLAQIAQLQGGLWYFPLIYGLFLLAYLIGGVVYDRRMALGVNPPRSPEALAERARAETLAVRNGILTHAYGFAAHGNRAGALKHIDAYLATDEDTLEARLWIFNQMTAWDVPDAALEFGGRVIDYCEQNGFTDETAKVRLALEHLKAKAR